MPELPCNFPMPLKGRDGQYPCLPEIGPVVGGPNLRLSSSLSPLSVCILRTVYCLRALRRNCGGRARPIQIGSALPLYVCA